MRRSLAVVMAATLIVGLGQPLAHAQSWQSFRHDHPLHVAVPAMPEDALTGAIRHRLARYEKRLTRARVIRWRAYRRSEREAAQRLRVYTSSSTPPAPAYRGSVADLIRQVFGSASAEALRIAECESGLDPSRQNPSGAAGVFQLMPFWWNGQNAYGWVFDPFDAYANIVHAHLIYLADGWGPWVC